MTKKYPQLKQIKSTTIIDELRTIKSEIEIKYYPTEEFIYLDIDKFKKILFSGVLEVNSSFDINK